MAFWFLEKRGHGKFQHFLPKQVSSKKAKELEDQGIQLFDTRKEAQTEANRQRGQ